MDKEEKNIDRNKLNTIFVIIGKRVDAIAKNQDEFNLIMDQVISFVNSDDFSFGQLDVIFNIMEKKRPKVKVRKEVLMMLYIKKTLPLIENVKMASKEEKSIYEKALQLRIQQFNRYVETEKIDFKSSTAGDILDQIVPINERDFKTHSVEILEGVKSKLNERYSNLLEEDIR